MRILAGAMAHAQIKPAFKLNLGTREVEGREAPNFPVWAIQCRGKRDSDDAIITLLSGPF